MMKVLSLLFTLTAILIFSGGCAVYSFSPGGKSSIKTISVSQFENETIEYGLSDRMTDLVIDAFINDGTLKVVPPGDADAILSGILTEYERKAYTYDENNNVSQYAVEVVFNITLDKPDGENIWQERFYSEGIYDASIQTEDDGQIEAAGKLVIDIINRTTKSW
jgi:hypothetical protein